MKFFIYQGSKNTVIFNPDIIIDSNKISIPPTIVFHNSIKYSVGEFSCPSSTNEIWFNFGEYTIDKPSVPGSFRILWKEGNDYAIFRSYPPDDVVEYHQPPPPKFLKRVRNFIQRKIKEVIPHS